MIYPKIYLKPKKEESVLRLHPWIFSGAVARIDGQPEEGAVVEVFATDGRLLGVGHYQIGSIAVRLLAFDEVTIDHAFWLDRLRSAYNLRQMLGLDHAPENDTYRLVYGEGDRLPGLVIDMYADTAVMQAHSVGMHHARHDIATALRELLGDRLQAIYYKSDGTLPFKAALDHTDEYLLGRYTGGEHLATERGLRFGIDWLKGQKTGFFVDQRENRRLLEQYAGGRTVLNMFCYTGGFSVYAMRGGARAVHSVDSSSKAVSLTERNVALPTTTATVPLPKTPSITSDVPATTTTSSSSIRRPSPSIATCSATPSKGIANSTPRLSRRFGPEASSSPSPARRWSVVTTSDWPSSPPPHRRVATSASCISSPNPPIIPSAFITPKANTSKASS